MSFTKSRVGIVIFGHILITVGAYLITYGIYLVIKFKPEPTFLNIIGLPIFWGIFSIFGGVCSIFHGMCNCVRTFGISIQNEKLKK
ncbi:hypothetical protein J7L48_08920 [bacterium]|nr:hypothetical protein [bacterium]